LIYVEGFASISKVVHASSLYGLKIYKAAPMVPQIFFTDSNIIKARDNESEAEEVMRILYSYEMASR